MRTAAAGATRFCFPQVSSCRARGKSLEEGDGVRGDEGRWIERQMAANRARFSNERVKCGPLMTLILFSR